MKKLSILFLFISITSSYSQIVLVTDTLELLNPPNNCSKIYIVDPVARFVNGKPYTGIDTTNIICGGEKLIAIEIFKDGFKVGLQTFYDNGKSFEYYEFKDGKENGISKAWYKNGQLKYEYPLKDGRDNGTHVMYYQNGSIEYISDRRKGISVSFYENGRTKSRTRYFDSIKCNSKMGYEETRWYEDGDLESKIISNCGKQLYQLYYNDSTIFSEETIIDMAMFNVGKCIKWYKDGTKMMEGQYKDGNTREDANIKTGVWKYYNEKGKLEKEETYENNQLINVKPYIKETLKN